MPNPENGQTPNGKPAENGNKVVPTAMEPIQVTVIGSGTGTGDGSSRQLVKTPEGQPDIVRNFVTPLVAMAIRFANLFVATLLGTLTLKMAPTIGNPIIAAIQAADFYQLVIAGSSVALASALYGLIKDAGTILSGLEKTHPLATGSV